MKPSIVLTTLIFLVLISVTGLAQVGIGTVVPRSSAMLEIQSTDKGLLIPKFESIQDVTLSPRDSSMLVFALDVNKFMYWNGTKWLSLTAFETSGSDTANIRLFANNPNAKLGLGVEPTNSSERLQVAGNVKIDGNIAATNNISSSNNISAINNIETTSGEFIGRGIMPVGSIVMWSGDFSKFTNGIGNGGTNMEGWALCDGDSGRPDLRGRFIVGYSGTGSYNNIGNTGGLEKVKLTAAQSGVPPHKHIAITTGTTAHDGAHTHSVYKGNGTSGGGFDQGSKSNTGWYGTNTGAHSHTLNASTLIEDNVAKPATSSHENRPPYYVLAFIIRVQ